ncbi:putative ABC transporter A, ABCA [Rosa chinensis]|uniref:Putative ABC transporter A, ABCA n=1 Tax=Rosa chinensis TaxID=74649 RepID=A0A2P6S4K2_ROSCH|nr:putative ABC transporter A, ABCA [Rosa chinensis]
MEAYQRRREERPRNRRPALEDEHEWRMRNGRASFCTLANALLRKNLTFQKRNMKQNVRLVSIPILPCIMLLLIHILVNHELDKPKNRCGCVCVETDGDGECEKVCGLEYSTVDQGFTSLPKWVCPA